MKKSHQNEILATFGGVGAIAGFAVLDFPLLLSGAAGLGIYLGVKLLTYKSRGVKLNFENLPEELQGRVQETSDLLLGLQEKQKKVKQGEIKQRLQRILDLGQKVVEVLSDDVNASTLLRDVNKLFKNLDTMLEKYLELASHTTVSYDRQSQVLADFEKLLSKIEKSLENYYRKGIKSDLTGFEVDMKLMETKLDAENKSSLE
jgi:hypothetical protein